MTFNSEYKGILFILLFALMFLGYLFAIVHNLPAPNDLQNNESVIFINGNSQKSSPIKFNEIMRDNLLRDNKTCSTFKAFIYPLISNSSIHVQNLYDQLLKSNYAVKNSKKACVFVAVIDNPNQIESLEFLNGNEDKHIVYLLNGSLNETLPIEHYFSGDVLGQNGLFLEFDSGLEKSSVNLQIKNEKEKILLQAHFDEISQINLIGSCETNNNDSNSKCLYSNSLDDIVQTPAHFTYIGYKNSRQFNAAFRTTLLSNSIPVISGYNFNKLPLSDLIEWENAVIRVPPNRILSMLEILKEFDEDQIWEMKRRGKFYFDNYFRDYRALTRSTLSAIRYRMQILAPIEEYEKTTLARDTIWPLNYTPTKPHNIQNLQTTLQNAKHVFNVDLTFLDIYSPYDTLWKTHNKMFSPNSISSHLKQTKRGIEYSSKLNGNVLDEEFTIILQAYKRDNQLRHVLQKLNGIRFCRQIIVYWVDSEREPSPTSFWPQINVPIHFVLAKSKSINKRFMPFDLIDTEAVFSMDDDFEVENDLIEFSFRVWRENRDVLVGPNERLGYIDSETKEGIYKSEVECNYNIILTSGAFLHRNYLVAYWKTQSLEIRQFIDWKTNCEDIAMAFLVSHLSRKPSIKTTPVLYTKGTFVEKIRLSKRPEHLKDRAKCVQIFEQIYGYNPLLLSEYRADSVHYQHDNEYQCFKGT